MRKKFKKKLRTINVNKYLMYIEANNLYGVSMLKPLPYKNFKWSDDTSEGITLNKNNLHRYL